MDKLLNFGPLVALLIMELIRFAFDERIGALQQNLATIKNRQPQRAIPRGSREAAELIAWNQTQRQIEPLLTRLQDQIKRIKRMRTAVIVIVLASALIFTICYR